MRPVLVSFDVFGTLVDWQRGFAEEIERLGLSGASDLFDRVVDYQAELEQQAPFVPYQEIAAVSFLAVAGIPRATAQVIAQRLGSWPFFEDVLPALQRLKQAGIRTATLTNSDLIHGQQLQTRLGSLIDHWICAELVGTYKPDSRVWEYAAKVTGVAFGSHWWHVSAYRDFDLDVAADLGLTTVLVRRPHCRPGPATHVVDNLHALALLAAS